jgi:hypothetical protein
VNPVIADGEADPRGAAVAAELVLSAYKQVDPARYHDGGWVEDVFGRPLHDAA